jgi:hypothetical protein
VSTPEPQPCQRCGIIGHDRRTLWMACFYAMNELGVPFTQRAIVGDVVKPTDDPPNQWGGLTWQAKRGDEEHAFPFFTLYVCKGCRSEWMKAIRDWYQASPGRSHAGNTDESTYGLEEETLPRLLVDAERVRLEMVALNQRAEALVGAARWEQSTRDAIDRPKCGEFVSVGHYEGFWCGRHDGHAGEHGRSRRVCGLPVQRSGEAATCDRPEGHDGECR